MRVVHFYPFVPSGRHGGTLRLRAAVAGTARCAKAELHYFDLAAAAWRRASRLDLAQGPSPPPAAGLKRRLFPSTLWESGRRARGAFGAYIEQIALDPDSVVFLHTTYLAPVLKSLPFGSPDAIVDVYDLVWRAHANDAQHGPAALRALRAAYAASIRPREYRALARAATVLAAGYEDYQLLRREVADVRWVPTPTPVEPAGPLDHGSRELRVGLLGNFGHESTRVSAQLLIGSKLAADPRVTIVLAGLHSDTVASSAGIELRGMLERAECLYADVDCIVAPVVGGSGMKVKLAEALIAGRPVVTTALGAAGYPPSVSRFFIICEPGDLDRATIRRAIASFDRTGAHAALERELGWEAVLELYEASVARAQARSVRTLCH